MGDSPRFFEVDTLGKVGLEEEEIDDREVQLLSRIDRKLFLSTFEIEKKKEEICFLQKC